MNIPEDRSLVPWWLRLPQPPEPVKSEGCQCFATDESVRFLNGRCVCRGIG